MLEQDRRPEEARVELDSDVVEGAPKPIKENVDKKTADEVKKKLEESGAKVSVIPSTVLARHAAIR